MLTKEQVFVCEITWGCVPVDTEFVLNSNLFKENWGLFKIGNFNHLYNK